MEFLRLRWKFVILMIALLISSLVVSIAWTSYTQKEQAENEMKEKAYVLVKQMDAVWSFMSINQDVINYTFDGEYEFKGLHCSLVGKSIGVIFSQEVDYITRYTNFDPRNPDDTPDEFEEEALNAFLEDTTLTEYYAITTYEGVEVFRYVSPMIIDESCLECHGEPAGELDVLGFEKEGWEIGDLGGAISIIMPTELYAANIQTSVVQNVIFFLGVMFLAIVLIFVAVSILVTRPLSKLENAVKEMRQGNMNVKVEDIGTKSEISDLAEGFNAMADELNALYGNLENKVESRTNELATANKTLELQRAQLEDINERLVADNEFKSDFLAIMSHELRTPLTSIIAFAELIEKNQENASEPEKRMVKEILGNSQLLLNMINNILEMARIESGKTVLVLETIDLGDIVNSVEEVVAPLIAKKNIELNTKIARDVPLINGDWEKIKRITENLISNAVKFTGAGGKIDLLICYIAEKDEVQIKVKDNGIGIEKKDLPFIFEKFVQVDASASRRYNGSGLGLALTKEFAELHGGRVDVTSELDVGSTFFVYIPVNAKSEVE